MRINENEFKIGNYIYTSYSYDGGFGRGAEIYEIVGLTAKSIKIKKVCEKSNCDCSNGESLKIINNDKIKTVKVKTVDEKDFYKWRLGQQYVVITDDFGGKCTAWSTEQFTDFNDIKDTGSDYELI